MILHKQTIEELQEILKTEFGRDVDFKTASSIAHDLTGYFNTLAKVAHKDKKITLVSRSNSHFDSFCGNPNKEQEEKLYYE